MVQFQSRIRYFLYARKSSESEDRQVASIDSQIENMKNIAKRGRAEIVEVLSEAQSAKAPGRPVFNQMPQRICRGEAQCVICWELDRLARNPVDGGQVSWMLSPFYGSERASANAFKQSQYLMSVAVFADQTTWILWRGKSIFLFCCIIRAGSFLSL
jgi:hypothetical protein